MAIGKRIEERLARLGWRRNDLLNRVPDLTPQALSNLIRRDSVRSEWDEAIAEALGVSVLWLVYGRDDDGAARTIPLRVSEPPAPAYASSTVKAIAEVAADMSPEGQLVLLGRAQELQRQYPKAAKNHSG